MTCRLVGFVGGTAGMYYALRRMKNPPRFAGLCFYTLLGGLGGSMLMVPFGIAWSRSSLRSIEDPRHLMNAMQYTMDQRRRGIKTNPLSDAPTAEPVDRSNDWADAAPRSSEAPPAASANWSSSSWGDAPPSSSAPKSRWDELRQNRTSEPSQWEHLRQQHARNALPAEARGKASPPPPSDEPVSDYDRAMKEYRAAFERERQGIDVTTGFVEQDNTLRT